MSPLAPVEWHSYGNRRLRLALVRLAMRAEWDRLKVRWHPLVGVYAESYPAYAIAAWEDRAAIRRSQPKPEGKLVRSEDGKLLLVREDGGFPALVTEDAPGAVPPID